MRQNLFIRKLQTIISFALTIIRIQGQRVSIQKIHGNFWGNFDTPLGLVEKTCLEIHFRYLYLSFCGVTVSNRMCVIEVFFSHENNGWAGNWVKNTESNS
jgi:hypothetical protein